MRITSSGKPGGKESTERSPNRVLSTVVLRSLLAIQTSRSPRSPILASRSCASGWPVSRVRRPPSSGTGTIGSSSLDPKCVRDRNWSMIHSASSAGISFPEFRKIQPHSVGSPVCSRTSAKVTPSAIGTRITSSVGRPYAEQIKPFNFLLTCQVASFGQPSDVDPEHFQLIAPWEPDSRRWVGLEWFNKYSPEGESYGIDPKASPGTAGVAKVTSYGDVLSEYRVHPEPKKLCRRIGSRLAGTRTACWRGDL